MTSRRKPKIHVDQGELLHPSLKGDEAFYLTPLNKVRLAADDEAIIRTVSGAGGRRSYTLAVPSDVLTQDMGLDRRVTPPVPVIPIGHKEELSGVASGKRTEGQGQLTRAQMLGGLTPEEIADQHAVNTAGNLAGRTIIVERNAARLPILDPRLFDSHGWATVGSRGLPEASIADFVYGSKPEGPLAEGLPTNGDDVAQGWQTAIDVRRDTLG